MRLADAHPEHVSCKAVLVEAQHFGKDYKARVPVLSSYPDILKRTMDILRRPMKEGQGFGEGEFREALSKAVWGLCLPANQVGNKRYGLIGHYFAQICLIDSLQLRIKTHRDVVDFVDFFKARSDKPKAEVLHEISTSDPRWLGPSARAADRAYDFAMRLWLLVDTSGSGLQKTVSDHMNQLFPKASSGLPVDEFDRHFNIRSLTQVSGLKIIRTPCVSDHLRFDEASETFSVFNLVEFLRSPRAAGEADHYPPGLLEETRKTLFLLGLEDVPHKDRSYQLWSRRPPLDIEMVVVEEFSGVHDPSTYPYWGERLCALHRAHEKSKPKRLRQFWQDRRDTNQWSAFWLAVVVIILTLLFGLVQSVTGIIQVAISYRSQACSAIPAKSAL